MLIECACGPFFSFMAHKTDGWFGKKEKFWAFFVLLDEFWWNDKRNAYTCSFRTIIILETHLPFHFPFQLIEPNAVKLIICTHAVNWRQHVYDSEKSKRRFLLVLLFGESNRWSNGHNAPYESIDSIPALNLLEKNRSPCRNSYYYHRQSLCSALKCHEQCND